MRFPLFLCKAFIGVPSQAFFTPPIHTDGVAVRMNAQRTASVAPLAPLLNRHSWWHATTFQNRAQPTGRASGVNCTQCWAARVACYRLSDKESGKATRGAHLEAVNFTTFQILYLTDYILLESPQNWQETIISNCRIKRCIIQGQIWCSVGKDGGKKQYLIMEEISLPRFVPTHR